MGNVNPVNRMVRLPHIRQAFGQGTNELIRLLAPDIHPELANMPVKYIRIITELIYQLELREQSVRNVFGLAKEEPITWPLDIYTKENK